MSKWSMRLNGVPLDGVSFTSPSGERLSHLAALQRFDVLEAENAALKAKAQFADDWATYTTRCRELFGSKLTREEEYACPEYTSEDEWLTRYDALGKDTP